MNNRTKMDNLGFSSDIEKQSDTEVCFREFSLYRMHVLLIKSAKFYNQLTEKCH